MRNLIEVNDLSVQAVHRGSVLVDAIHFVVHPRETVGFVGFSAAGKTLTALALFRLLPDTVRITGGSVRAFWQGKSIDVLSLSEAELAKLRGRFVSYIFQEPRKSLNPVLPVGKQIDELFVHHNNASFRQAQEQTYALLEKVGFSSPERIYHCFPHQLSGGECQRVIIASAIALKPALIIADEPTASLDVTTEVRIVQLLKTVTASVGATLVFITHNLYLLQKIADRVIFIEQGRIKGMCAMTDAHGGNSALTDPYVRQMFKSMPEFGKKIV